MKARAIGCVVGAVVVGGGVLAAACGGKATSVTCGAGTQLVGATCVAGGGGKEGGASDADADAKLPVASDAAFGDADLNSHRESGADATTPWDGDATDPGSDADAKTGADAAPDASSVPVSCGDINACVSGSAGTPAGPVDLGTFDPCVPNGWGVAAVTGDESEWFVLHFAPSCQQAQIGVSVISPPSSPFDIAIFGEFSPPAGACPADAGSAVAVPPPDGGGVATAFLMLQDPYEYFVHVTAERDAGCSSGSTWELNMDPF